MKLRNKKTGLTGVLNFIGFNIDDSEKETDITIVLDNTGGECIDKQVYSLDELKKFFEEWEEVKEPLIKDEKIRKAVRAWAEANGIKKIIVFDCGNNAPYTPVGAVDFAENGSHLEIRFRTEGRFDTDRIYTIAELCGEEE